MGDWMSLLPNAPMVGGAADAQTKFAGARKASAEANDAQYQMQARQAVAGIAAKSIDPATGRPDAKRFYALAAQSPYGDAAMKMFNDVIYPQMEKEIPRGYAAAATTAEGGIDQGALAGAIQQNPEFAPEGIRLGRGLAQEGAATAANVAENQARLGSLTGGSWATQKPGAQKFTQANSHAPAVPVEVPKPKADPSSLIGLGQIEGRIPTAEASYAEPTEADAVKMTPEVRSETVKGLQSRGFPIKPDATPKEIAEAQAAFVAQEVGKAMPGYEVGKFGEYNKALQEFQAKIPALAQTALASLSAGGREVAGTRLGQTGQKQGISGWESAESGRQSVARSLGVSADLLGKAGDPGAVATGKAMLQRGGAYSALRLQSEELANKIAKISRDPSKQMELNQETVSITQLINDVRGGSQAENAMEKSLQESGVPKTLLDAHSPLDAFRITLTTSDPKQSARLIRNLPDILFRNVLGPDFQAIGGDPEKWKTKLDGSEKKGGWATKKPSEKPGAGPAPSDAPKGARAATEADLDELRKKYGRKK